MTDITTEVPVEDPLTPPVAVDPESIREEIISELQARIPAWRPIPGSLDMHLIGVFSIVMAESRQAAIDRLRTELLDLLGTLFGVPRNVGAPATSTITVTAVDDVGHTLDAWTSVWLGQRELVTTSQLVIAPGQTSGSVAVQAVEPGADANGQTGTLIIDALDWLDDTVGNPELDEPLDGGSDPWTDLEYAIRIVEELQILSPRPVMATDYAVLARRHPSVTYAWAINLYDAVNDLDDQERYVTVIVADYLGEPIPSEARTEIQTDLTERSIANMVVLVVDANYVQVDAAMEIVVRDGFDAAAVIAQVTEQVTSRLTPAGHLQPRTGGFQIDYVPPQIIHVNDLISAAYAVEGLLRVETAQIDDGEADHIDLGDKISLPTPGTITITEAA